MYEEMIKIWDLDAWCYVWCEVHEEEKYIDEVGSPVASTSKTSKTKRRDKRSYSVSQGMFHAITIYYMIN